MTPNDTPANRHQVAASVIIHRPLAEVYDFYHDLTNLPKFLGDVTASERTGPTTYRWTVVGPLGATLHWDVAVVEDAPQHRVRYQTGSGMGEWDVSFAAVDGGHTRVQETLHLPLEWLTAKLLALAGKPPQAEVEANLQRLKEVLETGQVTTLAHVVPGKFGVPPR